MSKVEMQMTQHQAASLDALQTLWNTLENSPLTRALSEPLPFELPPGHNAGADDSDSEDEPGQWYRGMEWLHQLRQARAIQRHLTKYSPQGDMLFPEEYITSLIEKEEREWREWDQHTRATHAVGSTADDVNIIGEDDDDLDEMAHYNPNSQPNYNVRPHQSSSSSHSSYAAAVASAGKHSDVQRIEDVGALTSSHANQDVMYDESGQAFDAMDNAYYDPAHFYHPEASQFDPRSGLMTTPPIIAHNSGGVGGFDSSSSAAGSTFVGPLPQAGAPSPSSSPNLSAFQSYEGFGGHPYAPDRH